MNSIYDDYDDSQAALEKAKAELAEARAMLVKCQDKWQDKHDAVREKLAEALAQVAAKDAALNRIANYKGTYVGGAIFMAEVARQALAAPARETVDD